MDRLDRLRIFTRVAELSSFSAAARELRLAQSQVSRAMQDLEGDVGCSLFTRSTRVVSLTSEGAQYLEGVRGALNNLAEANEVLRATNLEIKGPLRITAPVAFGDTLAPVLASLVARHPGLTIDSVLVDRATHVVEEGFDVAIRTGPLQPSSLRARKLGSIQNVLVAAPSYLSSRAVPQKVDDLKNHEHVLFTVKATLDRLSLFDANGRSRTVRVDGRVRTNELRVANLLVLAGAGIAAIPLPLARASLKSGKLVRVLPAFSLRPIDIHALFPPLPLQPARVTAFVDAVDKALRAQRAAAEREGV